MHYKECLLSLVTKLKIWSRSSSGWEEATLTLRWECHSKTSPGLTRMTWLWMISHMNEYEISDECMIYISQCINIKLFGSRSSISDPTVQELEPWMGTQACLWVAFTCLATWVIKQGLVFIFCQPCGLFYVSSWAASTNYDHQTWEMQIHPT